MIKIILTEEDNQLLNEHINLFNKDKDIVEEKVTMDCYVESIEYINSDIYLNLIGREVILPEGISSKNKPSDTLPIGERTTMVLSKIRDKDIKSIIISFLRDFKILKLDINEN